MPTIQDGPFSSLFAPVSILHANKLTALADSGLSETMVTAAEQAPSGNCVGWGIPFEIRELIILSDEVVSVDIHPTTARWLVFMHTSDLRDVAPNQSGLYAPMRGEGQLAEHAANYLIRYQDGHEISIPIRRRFQLGILSTPLGGELF